jgi:hypothetical protein
MIYLQSEVFSLDLEDQVPVFMSPGDRVAELHPQAPSSLFIAFD